MNEPSHASIVELLADRALIDAAISRAVREAVLQTARAGQPVATWKDGAVVWVSPAEILTLLSDPPTS